MVRANDLIRRRRRGIVRSPALRKPAFIWLKDISIGFRSGEYLGRWRSVAPRASIASRTPAALCAGRLSIITMSFRLRVGARQRSTKAKNLFPFIAPSIVHDAVMPFWRRAATKVIVFQ